MAKKLAVQKSFVRQAFDSALALAKRNPLATIAAAIAILAGIPGAVAGAAYLRSEADSWTPVFKPEVYITRDGKTVHVTVVAQRHDIDIDYLILKEQHKALSEAKEDLRRDPNSTSAPENIKRLQRSIDERQKRLDAATKR